MEQYKLKSVALHITNECSANCPFCYYTKEGMVRCEGNLEVLKRIALNLRNAGVLEINLVGGDPAEYSKIQELVEYLYGLGFKVPILSNTHVYKNTDLESVIPYVSSLEGTFHAACAQEHNRFNRTKRSYEIMLENLKKYDELRKSYQQLGAVLNVTNQSYNKLFDIISSLLKQGLNLDYVLIQRIGSYGRAEKMEAILREKLIIAFKQIERINKELGISTSMVDAFPLCLIPNQYHEYLDRCDWGYGTASVDMNGNITRCAVANHTGENLLGNVLETPVTEIWNNSPTLVNFRNKRYLDEQCHNCELLAKCGGGCPISNGNNTLSSDVLLRVREK